MYTPSLCSRIFDKHSSFKPRLLFSKLPGAVLNLPGLQIVLSSDEEVFGGWKNVSKEYDVDYQTTEGKYDGRPHSFLVYAPSRTVAVLAPSEYVDSFADQSNQGIPGLGVKNRGPEFKA